MNQIPKPIRVIGPWDKDFYESPWKFRQQEQDEDPTVYNLKKEISKLKHKQYTQTVVDSKEDKQIEQEIFRHARNIANLTQKMYMGFIPE